MPLATLSSQRLHSLVEHIEEGIVVPLILSLLHEPGEGLYEVSFRHSTIAIFVGDLKHMLQLARAEHDPHALEQTAQIFDVESHLVCAGHRGSSGSCLVLSACAPVLRMLQLLLMLLLTVLEQQGVLPLLLPMLLMPPIAEPQGLLLMPLLLLKVLLCV